MLKVSLVKQTNAASGSPAFYMENFSSAYIIGKMFPSRKIERSFCTVCRTNVACKAPPMPRNIDYSRRLEYIITYWIIGKEESTVKIEKISDTQIRCTLTSDDLSMRNLNIRELAYGTEKAKNLFSEMMQLASSEVGFDPEGQPLMIEAIPCRDEGIILLITKVEDPEEVDTRFARFSPSPDEARNPLEALISMINEAVPGIAGPLTQRPQLAPDKALNTHMAFVFPNLDGAIEAARAMEGEFDGENCLYKNPQTKEYYLYISGEGSDPAMYASTCNVLSEYAGISLHNNQGRSYMEEHYETIIKGNALRALSQI